ncbi:N-acyl-D-amino-acid deacylase family protein [Amphibiibacter pelophylacis]|uniref:D-aminoacylase n=1 Tax=Amphibiibacter pelophylacis TaxID=1799477 RepID=A0ACC6NZT8_9BURK
MSDISPRTVLRNARVFDGSGSAPYSADVLLADGLIRQIAPCGSLPQTAGQAETDLDGLALAPGFIDTHTHDDRLALIQPQMWPKLSQGVTTVITGNCGLSLAPWQAPLDPPQPPAPLTLLGASADFVYDRFADYARAVDAAQPALNVASLVGHATLRLRCMADTARAATPDELDAMRAVLRESLQAGALGLSSGVFYAPARAAGHDELVPLLRDVAQHGGLYTSHIRDEYAGVLDALNEACDAGEAALVPVLLSHHKCAGPANWGRTVETLALVAERQRRHPVRLDAYPYPAGSTVLDPDYVDGVIRIMISWSTAHPEMAGRDLADIAVLWGVDQKEAARRLMPAGAVYFQMREDDVRRVLSFPHTMIGSDGLPHDQHPHPRLWGTFTRVLGHYSRDEGLFHLAEAVRRMTSLPADTFGLSGRGRIRPGLAADLVAFDPDTVRDRATFEQPCLPSEGIAHVWVAGVQAVHDGQATGARAGRWLRRQRERFGDCATPVQEAA